MNRGFFKVTPELLVEKLNLPYDTQIIGAEWDFSEGVVKIYVTHPDFSEMPQGCPAVYYTYESKWSLT